MSTTYTDLTESSYPDAIDIMTRMSDASYAYKALISQYYTYKNAGTAEGDTAAAQLLIDNPVLDTMIINAKKINKFIDACIALERWYNDDIKPFFEYTFAYKGEYVPATTYKQGNVISYNGEGFICRVASSVGVSPTAHTTTTNWAIIAKQGIQGVSGTGLAPRGAWNNSTTYSVNDCVSHSNSLWQCLVENTNSEPVGTNSNWVLLFNIAPEQIGAATTTTLTATIPVEWTYSNGYYYQTITVSGMLETDNPIVDIVPSSDNATNVIYNREWSKVLSIDTNTNSVTIWCAAQPTSALPVVFKVVR